MLDREEVLSKAAQDCYREMFAKAQPMADWDCLNAEYKAGKIDEEKDAPVYDRHYLSHEEFVYILDKYMKAYHIESDWNDYVEIVERYLNEGGTKDKYIEACTDENGNYHPGYRGYEDVPPLKEHIRKVIDEYLENKELNQTREEMSQDITNKVMELISTCKNFYCLNMDERKFRNTMCMGASPTGSMETVKKWWKDHYDIDIKIEERNPLLLWEYDNYGDEMDDIMTEEYGKNWKKIWDKKWKEEKKRKEDENKKRMEELLNKTREKEKSD